MPNGSRRSGVIYCYIWGLVVVALLCVLFFALSSIYSGFLYFGIVFAVLSAAIACTFIIHLYHTKKGRETFLHDLVCCACCNRCDTCRLCCDTCVRRSLCLEDHRPRTSGGTAGVSAADRRVQLRQLENEILCLLQLYTQLETDPSNMGSLQQSLNSLEAEYSKLSDWIEGRENVTADAVSRMRESLSQISRNFQILMIRDNCLQREQGQTRLPRLNASGCNISTLGDDIVVHYLPEPNVSVINPPPYSETDPQSRPETPSSIHLSTSTTALVDIDTTFSIAPGAEAFPVTATNESCSLEPPEDCNNAPPSYEEAIASTDA